MYAGLHLSPAPALSLTWTLSIASFHRLCAPLKSGIAFPFQASHLLCTSVLLHRYIRSRNSCIYRNEGGGGHEKKDPPSRLGASLIKQQDVRPRICVSQRKYSRVFLGQCRSYSYRGKVCGGGGAVLFHLCEDRWEWTHKCVMIVAHCFISDLISCFQSLSNRDGGCFYCMEAVM